MRQKLCLFSYYCTDYGMYNIMRILSVLYGRGWLLYYFSKLAIVEGMSFPTELLKAIKCDGAEERKARVQVRQFDA